MKTVFDVIIKNSLPKVKEKTDIKWRYAESNCWEDPSTYIEFYFIYDDEVIIISKEGFDLEENIKEIEERIIVNFNRKIGNLHINFIRDKK